MNEIIKNQPDFKIASFLQRWVAQMVDGLIAGLLLSTLIGIPFGLAYWILRDSLPSLKYQSLGKKIMKIKVIILDSQMTRMDMSWRRHLHTLLPLFAIIDGIILLTNKENRRLGDKWAQTVVFQDLNDEINLMDSVSGESEKNDSESILKKTGEIAKDTGSKSIEFLKDKLKPKSSMDKIKNELLTLSELKNEGLITEEDYQKKKKDILGV